MRRTPVTSIAIALTWEYWRRCWRWVLLAWATGLSIMLFLYMAIRFEGQTSFRDTEHGRILHLVGLFSVLLYFVSIGVQDRRRTTDRFALPVATCLLVACDMLNAILAAAVGYVSIAGILNAMFDAGWPMLGPTIFIVVSVVWGQTIFWSLYKSPGLVLVSTVAMILVLGNWCFARYGIALFASDHGTLQLWTYVTSGELLTMVAMWVIGCVSAVVGVSLDRRGDSPGPGAILKWCQRLVDRCARRRHDFRSPQQALFWQEWRQKGRAMPLVASMVTFPLVILAIQLWQETEEALRICAACTMFMLMISAYLGVFIGHASQNLELGDFRATQPVVSPDLSSAVLKNAMFSTILSWLVWLLGMIAVLVRFSLRGELGFVHSRLTQFEWAESLGDWSFVVWLFILAGLVLASWTLIALGASLAMSRWVALVSISSSGFACFILGAIALNTLIPEEYHVVVFNSLSVLFGVCCLAGTLVAFVEAYRRRFIDVWLISFSAVGWSVLSAIAISILGWIGALNAAFALLMIGLLCLPFSPLATAPLAVAWNRHR